MKSFAMLVAATAAAVTLSTAVARSQEACAKSYGVCIDSCVTRPGKGLQNQCIHSCQNKNNQCSEKVYGARREINPPGQPTPDAGKALAKEVAPPPRQIDVAPRKSERPSLRKVEGPALRKVDNPPRDQAEPPARAEAQK